MQTIAKIKVRIEFADNSETFENFTEVDTAKEWLEGQRAKVEESNNQEKND